MFANADFTPPADPWSLFREWYALASQYEPDDTNAMSLATVGADGKPSLRMVLLKDYDARGLTFFTNRQSRKGAELARNPDAAICLHWKKIDRQIRAEGTVSLLSDAESDAYFATRARGSQIGAWASQQSRPLASRDIFEKNVQGIEKRYEGKPVPRPSYWGGYLLVPSRIEFWQERPFRLHDRILYHRADMQSTWAIETLYP